MRHLLASAVASFIALRSFAADSSLPAQARAALEKSTAYMRSISAGGGYLWKYSLDLQERAGEVKATATQVWIQPPGTPTVGMAFLRLYEATKDARYLDAAKDAADALATGQVESGGWDYLIDFDPEKMRLSYLRSDVGKLSPEQIAKRKNVTNFDDDNTQSAMRFLLAVVDAGKGADDACDGRIREALDYGLKKMIEAQYPNGAWPQRWLGKAHTAEEFPVMRARFPSQYPREFPKVNYYAHYTLNDNTLHDCIGVMLDAFRRMGKAEYLEAAKKGGDFIILAQMPEPQPVWAQQYNAQMEPAWARAFEPPAVTGNESVGVLRALMDLYVETGDEKFLRPIPAAIAWFKRSQLAPNRWALLRVAAQRPNLRRSRREDLLPPRRHQRGTAARVQLERQLWGREHDGLLRKGERPEPRVVAQGKGGKILTAKSQPGRRQVARIARAENHRGARREWPLGDTRLHQAPQLGVQRSRGDGGVRQECGDARGVSGDGEAMMEPSSGHRARRC